MCDVFCVEACGVPVAAVVHRAELRVVEEDMSDRFVSAFFRSMQLDAL
jgi:hypothetical protein